MSFVELEGEVSLNRSSVRIDNRGDAGWMVIGLMTLEIICNQGTEGYKQILWYIGCHWSSVSRRIGTAAVLTHRDWGFYHSD